MSTSAQRPETGVSFTKYQPDLRDEGQASALDKAAGYSKYWVDQEGTAFVEMNATS